MIPYFPQPSVALGPLTLYAFGALVALAVVVGKRLFERRAARTGLDAGVAGRLTGWLLVSGFIGAHLVERLFYRLDETLANPVSLLFLWDGLSSFGGFLGAVVGVGLFYWRNPQPGRAWRFLDALAFALPAAWAIARLGCFLAYDHPGRPTGSILGQEYVDGVVRHNLGLEEALFSAGLAVAIAALARLRTRPGFLVGALALLYAPGRFLLDFLRVAEERHLGLVVSQYASLALVAVGAVILWRVRAGRRRAGEGDGVPAS